MIINNINMPSREKLLYMLNKAKYGFIQPISYTCTSLAEILEDEKLDPIMEEPIETPTEDDADDADETDNSSFLLMTELTNELNGIRSNAKRKLEFFIRENSVKINSLDCGDKVELLEAIEKKFYKKKQ